MFKTDQHDYCAKPAVQQLQYNNTTKSGIVDSINSVIDCIFNPLDSGNAVYTSSGYGPGYLINTGGTLSYEVEYDLINLEPDNVYDIYYRDPDKWMWDKNRKANTKEVARNIQKIHDTIVVPLREKIKEMFNDKAFIFVEHCFMCRDALIKHKLDQEHLFSKAKAVLLRIEGEESSTVIYDEIVRWTSDDEDKYDGIDEEETIDPIEYGLMKLCNPDKEKKLIYITLPFTQDIYKDTNNWLETTGLEIKSIGNKLKEDIKKLDEFIASKVNIFHNYLESFNHYMINILYNPDMNVRINKVYKANKRVYSFIDYGFEYITLQKQIGDSMNAEDSEAPYRVRLKQDRLMMKRQLVYVRLEEVDKKISNYELESVATVDFGKLNRFKTIQNEIIPELKRLKKLKEEFEPEDNESIRYEKMKEAEYNRLKFLYTLNVTDKSILYRMVTHNFHIIFNIFRLIIFPHIHKLFL